MLLRRRYALTLRCERFDGDALPPKCPTSIGDQSAGCIAFFGVGNADEVIRAGDIDSGPDCDCTAGSPLSLKSRSMRVQANSLPCRCAHVPCCLLAALRASEPISAPPPAQVAYARKDGGGGTLR